MANNKYEFSFDLAKSIALRLLLCFFLFESIINYSNATTIDVIASVNGNAITNQDLEQRIAFLKMQNISGDLAKRAKQELVDEKLQSIEIERLKVTPSDKVVNERFAEFANKNGMSAAQFSNLLTDHDVSPEHFKDFMRTKIGWQNALIMRYRSENGKNGVLNLQDTIQMQLSNGGEKPKATEYNIQRIIFVMPDNPSKAIKDSRIRAIRYVQRNFRGCDSTLDVVRPLLDVAIKKEGRILEPELPDEWKAVIKKTPLGHVSKHITTPNGYEVFAICDKRVVSDDRVAQIIYSIKDSGKNSTKILKDLDEKYMKELKQSARITFEKSS